MVESVESVQWWRGGQYAVVESVESVERQESVESVRWWRAWAVCSGGKCGECVVVRAWVESVDSEWHMGMECAH